MSRLNKLLGTAVIASGQTTSTAVDTSDCAITGILIPASFEGTLITFTATEPDQSSGTYYPVYIADPTGGAVTIATTAATFIPVFLGELVGMVQFKIVSNVATAADRAIKIYGRNVL